MSAARASRIAISQFRACLGGTSPICNPNASEQRKTASCAPVKPLAPSVVAARSNRADKSTLNQQLSRLGCVTPQRKPAPSKSSHTVCDGYKAKEAGACGLHRNVGEPAQRTPALARQKLAGGLEPRQLRNARRIAHGPTELSFVECDHINYLLELDKG